MVRANAVWDGCGLKVFLKLRRELEKWILVGLFGAIFVLLDLIKVAFSRGLRVGLVSFEVVDG